MNGDISRLVELLSGYPNNVTVTAFDAETGAYKPLTGMIFNPQTMILELCTDSDTEQRTILREACEYSCGDFYLAEFDGIQQERIAELEAQLAAWEETMTQRSYTKCENFVNDYLTYINRQAGCIEYVDKNGNNCEEGFADNPIDAIQKAAEKVAKQRIVKY